MRTWRQIGVFVGGHMAFLVPICLVLGIFFPQPFLPLKPAVSPLFAFITFQNSLGVSLPQVARVFRHPARMLLALAVSTLVAPTAACLLATALFGPGDTVVGITLEYCVPIAVISTMWIGLFDGDLACGLATLVVSTLLSPLTIPLMLQLLVGAQVSVDAASMMQGMLLMIALPALAGMLTNTLTRAWAARELSPTLAPAARLLMLLIITTNSTSISDAMRHLTPALAATMAFVGVFSASCFVLGVVLAKALRLPHDQAVTLAFDCGLRNISAGAVIAGQYFSPGVMFPVMMGTLFQELLATAFGNVVGWAFPVGEGEDPEETA